MRLGRPQFVLLVMLFWYNRRAKLLPTNAAERELWTIWIGFFLAFGCILIATAAHADAGVLVPGNFDAACSTGMRLLAYPFISIIGGLAFFSMGSNYWGSATPSAWAFSHGRAHAVSHATLACRSSSGSCGSWRRSCHGRVHLRQLGQQLKEQDAGHNSAEF